MQDKCGKVRGDCFDDRFWAQSVIGDGGNAFLAVHADKSNGVGGPRTSTLCSVVLQEGVRRGIEYQEERRLELGCGESSPNDGKKCSRDKD